MSRTNNMLLNNEWLTNEIKEEMFKKLKQMKLGTEQQKVYGAQHF